MKQRDAIALTPAEQRDYIATARTLTLCTNGPHGYPHAVAMWFAVDAPPSATVEIGQTVSFSARTNEGDTDFDWTASDGTVDGGGTFTAPSKPGTVTVTATTRRILSGSATVTVKCPAGQVEFDGECRTISVTIAPANPALAPGAQQQFTATVHNTTNQAVTWTSSGGSITATGRFTAPSQPGSVTITARSKEDTTKTGTTTVTVRHQA